MKKHLLMIFALCVLLVLSSCAEVTDASDPESSATDTNEHISDADSLSENVSEESMSDEEQLIVHYFDVGQGDSVFIELPDDRCMLVDASISQFEQVIEQNIRDLGYDQIDYVVATHPHADHIGGMAHILNSFDIGCIYLPDVSAGTQTYINMAETILEKEIKANIAEAGVTVISESNLKAVFLAPFEIDEEDQNKNSAVLYLSYGESKFLFMGDADVDIEKQIGKVDCDVLKVGHHGSRTASDETFLRYASPRYAVISCGKDNSYGHPHQEATDRLSACGAEILRTDLLGDIIIVSDGKDITIGSKTNAPDESSAENGTMRWILNTNSKKIHEPTCKYVNDIADKNKAESEKTIRELLEEGYTACGSCKPHD